MISPLGKGHSGGTLNNTSSRGSDIRGSSGHTAGALGPAPTAAAEGPAAEDGPTAATSAAGDPATAEEEPATGEDGPWRTRGL